LVVRFGKPLHLPSVPANERNHILQKNTDEIMCHIAALLPAEYRGAYANHPRLQELVSLKDIN